MSVESTRVVITQILRLQSCGRFEDGCVIRTVSNREGLKHHRYGDLLGESDAPQQILEAWVSAQVVEERISVDEWEQEGVFPIRTVEPVERLIFIP